MRCTLGIFFVFFSTTTVGQTPPFVPHECLKATIDDCVNDCECSWCYSTMECITFVKVNEQCKNYTAKTHECKQNQSKSERDALIFFFTLVGCTALALFVGLTVWFWSCPDFKKYWRRMRPRVSSQGGYEYLL